MLDKARTLLSGAVKAMTGDGESRSVAARKAARTRKRNAQKRSDAARRGAQTRTQRKERVDAMVDATRRD